MTAFMSPLAQPHHAAYGRPVEDLSIVVIDPSRQMQTILRSMLQPLRAKRLRIYDTATDALRDMLVEPPNLVLTEWRMEPMSGFRLLKVMRHSSMAPLCFVPVVIVSGQATRSSVESAFRAGAHAVLVKPIAPSALRQRIDWLAEDARTFTTEGETWTIDGVVDLLDEKRRKEQLPAIIDEIELGARAHDARELVDKIVAGELVDGEIPEAALARQSRRAREEPAVSPTLDRLIRQRAEERRSPVRRTAKPAASRAQSGRWKEIWPR
jgi:PleD family two-component response regulator